MQQFHVVASPCTKNRAKSSCTCTWPAVRNSKKHWHCRKRRRNCASSLVAKQTLMQSGRTLSLEEATRDYPLFELRKLLSLRLNTHGAADAGASAKEDVQPLQFTAMAFGGYEGHSVIAMACSNGNLHRSCARPPIKNLCC